MKRIVLFVITAAVLSSCDHTRSKTSYYYALDSLLAGQSKLLSQSKASLTKEASLDRLKELKSYTPLSDSAWAHELDIFAELNDINKPANAGKYHTKKGVKDPNSNLLIYKIERAERAPVVFLNVYYLNNLSNIRKIEGFYYEESTLMKSSRQLAMEFQNINNKIVLTSYSITGGQKMLLGDSVQFSVTGTITLP